MHERVSKWGGEASCEEEGSPTLSKNDEGPAAEPGRRCEGQLPYIHTKVPTHWHGGPHIDFFGSFSTRLRGLGKAVFNHFYGFTPKRSYKGQKPPLVRPGECPKSQICTVFQYRYETL